MKNQFAELVERMRAEGLRVTEQRKSLVQLFLDLRKLLSPIEVYEYMSRFYPGISFDTVYRNLRTLKEIGILEQFHFDDGVKFRINCYSHHRHHHHLICLSCDKTVPLDFCPMKVEVNPPADFLVTHHKFEIYGYCKDCK